MKERFKSVMLFILMLFLFPAGLSVFMAVGFRDVRTGPMGDYLTGYLWHRFLDFYMIFVPFNLAVGALTLLGWLLYELGRER